MVYDVIIIGLGASGLAASIYAKRSGLNVAVINFSVPGGIINESSIVENYPGFKSISGLNRSQNCGRRSIPLVLMSIATTLIPMVRRQRILWAFCRLNAPMAALLSRSGNLLLMVMMLLVCALMRIV